MKKKYKIENNRLCECEDDNEIFWIELTNPSEDEVEEIILKYKIPRDYIYSVLDAQEVPRVEGIDLKKPTLFLLSYPEKFGSNKFSTRPISIIKTEGIIVTVVSEQTKYLESIKDYYINNNQQLKLENLVTEIAWKICAEFVKYVKELNIEIEKVEKTVRGKANSKVFSDMIDIQKSLLNFSMATRENGPVIDAMFKDVDVKKNKESEEILHDLQVENKQAKVMIEEATIVIENLSDLYSNLISYNLNEVMKVLTSITIVMTIPTIIGGLWGMNVILPFAENRHAFWILMLLIVVISWVIVKFLKNKDYL